MSNKRKIMRFVLLTAVAFALVVVVTIYYTWETNTSPCIPEVPDRIGEIPATARWIGGCDGGHWFNIEEMQPESNKYRVAVYFDYNGKLYVNEYFQLKCKKRYNSYKELLDDILYYEGEIRMKGDCDLIPMK
jgi:hypothetical protein